MHPDKIQVYIGIGTNLGQPEQQVGDALTAIQSHESCSGLRISDLYSSKPLGTIEQPDFVNAVAGFQTVLSPDALLTFLQEIEQAQGRTREIRWGPRTLDLDILLYGDLEVASSGLTIPHPGLLERDFVLYPLFQIAPDLEIPGAGKLSDCMRRCPIRSLKNLASGNEVESAALAR